MCKQSLCLVLIIIGMFACSASAELVGYWPFDAGSGLVAVDGSGNGNDGEIVNATWTAGQLGSALSFDGTAYVDVPPACWATVSDEVTLAFWINIPAADLSQSNFIMAAFSDPADNGARVFSCHLPWAGNTVYFDTSGPSYDRTSQAVPASDLVDAWSHWAFVKNAATGDATIYRNGELWHSASGLTKPLQGADITRFTIGTKASLAEGWYTGMIDDVQLYDHALTQDEVAVAMQGIATDIASAPNPTEDQIDVLRDVMLAWAPGEKAVTHNVYLGTSLEDVTNSSANVLVGDNISTTSLDAGVLNYGATYYWRVDEVNGAPDRTVFTGDVWSFTVEPIGIPVENITATASGANPDMGPEKTIDGSGMNDMDQHSAMPTDMWLTLTPDSWIQYEFDKAYKLHEMLIWNSNQVIEAFIGFGVKEATIETSLDGETWTAVDGVGELAKATGAPTYVADNAVAMGGVMAKYVKLSVISAHGFTGQSGLAEVRFLALPVTPREPQPADGVTTAIATVELGWRSGREAVSHEVSLGTDPANMAQIGTTTEASLTTDPLDYMTTYYWSVTEVNDAEIPTAHGGDVWSFSTPEYATVDDFESFSADADEEIYMTWFDGFGGDTALGGSTTGHFDAPFVETTIVYDGGQSMPIVIDNDGSFANIDGNVSSPNFSEVVRELDSQDWTASELKTLSIMFSGSAGLTGQLYCKIGSTKVVYDGDAANLSLGVWQAWHIDLSTVGGNLTNVKELASGVDGGTSGILYIDAIRLYPMLGETIVPADPGTDTLIGHWSFDENSGTVAADSSGNGNDGTIVSGSFLPGKLGAALSFADMTHVEIPARAMASVSTQVTVAFWNYAEDTPANNVLFCAYLDGAVNDSRVLSAHVPWGGQIYWDTSGDTAYERINKGIEDSEYVGGWHHWAFVKNADTGHKEIYLDGALWHSAEGMTKPMDGAGVTVFHIGASPTLANYYNGLVDEFQLYNEALSQEEILWLAGRTSTVAKPF